MVWEKTGIYVYVLLGAAKDSVYCGEACLSKQSESVRVVRQEQMWRVNEQK